MSTHDKNVSTMLNNCYQRIDDIRGGAAENDPLCIDEFIEIDIELSTGGPADGFKIYLDAKTRGPLRGCYYYSDWGWYEEEWLRPPELDLVVEHFGIV